MSSPEAEDADISKGRL